ncbi:MAG: hypothetical protein IJ389_00345 [Clostridia bacterium]|nr:hypothetical protein [Clostridia bacterium]
MGLFDIFKKKKEVNPATNANSGVTISPQAIVVMARAHQPENIYIDQQGQHLNPLVSEAVDKIMQYDGIMSLSMALMLNDPQTMQQKMRNADVDTLLIFFKFLAVKASETQNNQSIGMVQQFLISVLQEKLNTQTAKKQENLLFWAPSIYDGDPLTLSAPDYEIHVFPDAGQMINNGVKIQTDSALPAGYNFAQKGSGRVLHLRTIRNPQLNQEMVPLFTDPNLLLQIFTPNTRISIVDYQTARRFCLQDKNICSGIVINPGRDNRIISINQLEQEG